MRIGRGRAASVDPTLVVETVHARPVVWKRPIRRAADADLTTLTWQKP